MRQLLDWLDQRTGLRQSWNSFADERICGGARLRHVFGAVLLYLFILQAACGLVMAAHYAPSSTDAWASVAYFNDQVAGGWFLRGLHLYGSYALVIVSLLYVLQLVLTGGYRKPGELRWFAALGLLGLAIVTGLTGSWLSWDEQAAGRLAVEVSIMGNAPGGDIVKTLLLGGSEPGNLTLLRAYVLHVFILPIAFVALFLLLRSQRRRLGVVPPRLPEAELERRATHYFPNQMWFDALAIAVVSAILVGVTFKHHGAELFAPASMGSEFVAQPEWYFLPLYRLRSFFEGPTEVVATVILPGLVTGFLVVVPWLDRADSSDWRKRLPVIAAFCAIVAGAVAFGGLAAAANAKDEAYQKNHAQAFKLADKARAFAKEGVLPTGGDAVWWNDPRYKVRMLFKEHCQNCHAIDGVGGDEAPDLTDYRSRDYLSALIRNASDKRFFGNTVHEDMDPYPPEDLPDDQLKAVVEYMILLSGDESLEPDPELAKKGQQVFDDESNCTDCHYVEKGEENDGPNLFQNGSQAWIERIIRDSSKPDLFGEAAEMPKFEGKLSDEEIEQLAEFILARRNDDSG